jgi:hypothetical protein
MNTIMFARLLYIKYPHPAFCPRRITVRFARYPRHNPGESLIERAALWSEPQGSASGVSEVTLAGASEVSEVTLALCEDSRVGVGASVPPRLSPHAIPQLARNYLTNRCRVRQDAVNTRIHLHFGNALRSASCTST